MKRVTLPLAVGALAVMALGSTAAAQNATADMKSINGGPAGRIQLKETPSGVLITGRMNGLGPGPHAFHIHETGKCEPDTGFRSAGGHYSPAGRAHGYEAEKGPHAGDFPNMRANADGLMDIETIAPRVTLNAEKRADRAPLLGGNGTAIVVHSGADDYRSQPAGAAGTRVACGVITGS